MITIDTKWSIFSERVTYACGVNAIAAMASTGVLALELTTSTVTGEHRVNLGCRLRKSSTSPWSHKPHLDLFPAL